jgi:hypothetical protein
MYDVDAPHRPCHPIAIEDVAFDELDVFRATLVLPNVQDSDLVPPLEQSSRDRTPQETGAAGH